MAAELVHVDPVATPVEKNPISELQEVFQLWKLPMPQYREAHGTFSQFGTEVTVTIHSETMTFHSTGRTKKISKANAANAALDYIKTHEREMLEPPPSMAADDVEVGDVNFTYKKEGQANKQKSAAIDLRELSRETERLDHVHVGIDMGRLIQQNRQRLGMSQRDLASRINEKATVVSEYETGKALPNQQLVAKLERALGVHLRGEKAGQQKVFGRGRR